MSIPFTRDTSSILIVPGCSVSFSGKLQGPVTGLETIFAEHTSLEPAEFLEIKNHGCLFFLQCMLQSVADFTAVNQVIISFLNGGASGVYMEHCGCAWSANTFRDIAEGDFPLEGWLNFVETKEDLYTLGMESLGQPDLCISLLNGNSEMLRNELLCVTDGIFIDGLAVETGIRWMDTDGAEYEFRKETRLPYQKGSFEFNAKGVWRLIKRSKAMT